MSGRRGPLVLVVGPSGAGKDSVLRGAAQRFQGDARFVFPRRVITRHADLAAEDHDTISAEHFHRNCAAGEYALWWQAHDHGYGIPRNAIHGRGAGQVVVVNVSRSVIGAAAVSLPPVAVIEITAPAATLAARLRARGREGAAAVDARLARAVPAYPGSVRVERIENDGALDVAVSRFCEILRHLCI